MKRILTLSTICLSITFASTVAAESPHDDRQQVSKPSPRKDGPRMDVVFTIDATSSMSDEIAVIKKEVWAIANKIATGKPAPDLRLGLVLYRDTSDAKLVEVTPLTRDIDAIYEKLMAAQAMGGGDKPEHVGKGLHASLDLDWDANANVIRTIYLVGDAGASQHNTFTVETAMLRAKEMNVTINAIGCSGMTPRERAEFTKVASNNGGKFEPLTYYAVVEAEDGSKKSVVYFDGTAYEADGEISAKDWKEGGEKVIKKHKMKKAHAKTVSRASAAPKMNNLDSVVEKGMLDSAESAGVAY